MHSEKNGLMLKERLGKRVGKGRQHLGIEKEVLLKNQENLHVKNRARKSQGLPVQDDGGVQLVHR